MRIFVAAFLLLSGFFFAAQANAAATITFSQVGNDVHATVNGDLDLTGLIGGTTTTPNARVRGGGSGANVVIGPYAGSSTKFYSTISGPQSIGWSTDTNDASSGTSNPSGMFGINMAAPPRLLVPQNYNSGANVSASATWNGATMNSLGLMGGTYVYTWAGDSLTIIVPVSAPTVSTSAATLITRTDATLNGTVNHNGASTTVNFNYGLTNAYGTSATATQSPVATGTGPTSVSAPLTGLTCNTTYHFRVSATNSVNTTNGSDATFTTSACPAPTVTSISPTSGTTVGGTTITINGTNFTGATVVNFGASAAASFTINSVTSITATSPAGSGTVDITVTTLDGTSSIGVADQYTYVPPAAITPTNQTISATVGTAITSTETLSASGYSGTVSYAISPSLPSGLSLNSTSGVITGTPTVSQVATSYIITGTGATSGTATTTVILTVVNAVPSAPTAISASPGDAQASISWTAPSNGGATITSYTAAGTPGGQTCISSGNPADARCIVSGLTNGTTYSFTVTATNNVGTGPASLTSNLVTPASHALTPAAPATPSVAASDSQVSVSWEQVLTGGDPSSYLVTATPGGQTCTSSFPGRAFSSASCSVTGLTNGTAYTFKVLASNSTGSASSESSASVTPQAIVNGSCGTANGVASVVNPSGNLCESGTPTVVESGQGSFTWSCAGANGGNTAYCLAPGQLDTSQNATTTFTTPTANGCQIQRVQLLPVFNGGPGGGVTMPYEVLDFEMVGCQATQATVTMTYSQVVEGIDFWKYIRGNWIQLTQANSELALVGNTATFTILDNGPLDADPAVGQISDPAGPGYSSLPALPGTPVNPEATAGDSEAAVSWTAPSGGATPVTYTVTSTPDSRTCTALAPITTCNVNGLTNNTYYTFGVVANNAAGSGPVSSDSNSVTPSYSGQAGNCGTATTQASLTPPQTDLCSVGTASTVVAANGGYTWQCDAVGHNIAASCSAQGAASTGAIGSTTFNLLPGSGCSIKTAQIGNQAAATPTGVTLSNGVVSFTLTGCTQSADLSSTFSSAVNGLAQWEWIHQVWVTIPGAVLSGNAATFTIADNGPYDTDSTVGTISVASGPGNTNGKSSQQTLSLASNVNSIKSGRAVLLKVTGGSSNGRVSYSTQSSGGVSCSVRAVGNQSILKTSGKKNGTCSAWATKAAKATYNAAVSSPVTVNVTGAR